MKMVETIFLRYIQYRNFRDFPMNATRHPEFAAPSQQTVFPAMILDPEKSAGDTFEAGPWQK